MRDQRRGWLTTLSIGGLSDVVLGWLRVPRLVALAVLYALLASLTFVIQDGSTPAFFPAAGVTLAFMCLSDRRNRFAGAVVIALVEIGVDLAHGLGIGLAVLLAVANAGEPLLGVALLDRWLGPRPWSGTPQTVARITAAATVASATSAFIGGTALSLALETPWWSTASSWWAGDLLGVLVVTPVVLLIANRRRPRHTVVELVVSSVLATGAVAWLFLASSLPLSWALFPLVGWMAVRYDTHGAAIVSVIVSSVVFVAVAADRPFLANLLHRSNGLLLVHVMLIVLVIAAYALATEVRHTALVGHAAVESEASLRAVINEVPVAIIELDGTTSTVLSWNATAAGTFGVNAEQMVGKPLPLGADFTEHVALRDRALHDPDARRFSVTRRGLDGTAHHLDVAVQPRTTTDGQTIITAVIHDRTADITANAALRERLHTDHLTGLANRAVVDGALGDWIARSGGADRHIAVFCDLDGFKGVNDTYGHPLGDQLLIGVADRLRTCVRPNDIVARLAGDEFIILAALPCDPAIASFTDRVRHAFDQPFTLDNELISIGASIGHTTIRPTMTPTDVITAADTAMYHDKRNRRRAIPIKPQ